MSSQSVGGFRIANDLLGSPAQLKALLADEGYLFFRGTLDLDEVDATKRDLVHVLAGQGVVKPDRAEPIWTGAALDQIDDVALYSLSSYQALCEGSAKRLAEKVVGVPAFMF